MNTIQKLLAFVETKIAIGPLIVNFVIVVVLALLLKRFYIKYGHALSNRRIFANNFPILATTTFLVITIVKSSLALSLGMVGALSIVRFRAPIKEPEELAYLFLTLGIGIGIGADQRIPTIIIVILILFVIIRWQGIFMKTGENHNLYLNIEASKVASERDVLKKIDSVLKEYSNIIDIRRVDLRDNNLHATYYVDFDSNEILINALEKLKTIPNIALTFIDQDREARG